MGMVLWEEDVGGKVLWTTLQNQLTFSDLTFGDYFLLCPLSPISSFSYLNSVYMYMCTSPSSPLAPSDVSSPLVVMATSSFITVTGGLSSPARGPQTTIFNVQAQQMTLQTVVTGLQPVTTYLVYIYIHVAASTVGGQGVGPPAAISTLQFGKQEIDGHPYIDITLSSLPHLKTTTHICN